MVVQPDVETTVVRVAVAGVEVLGAAGVEAAPAVAAMPRAPVPARASVKAEVASSFFIGVLL